MQKRQADAGNWQARAQEFRVGQSVRLMASGETGEGRVVACWPAIGMVDVQWPHTANRHPVEELQIVNPAEDPFIAPMHHDVPGGAGTLADVSEGAPQENVVDRIDPQVKMVHEVGAVEDNGMGRMASLDLDAMKVRVAKAFVKKSLYWHARDRKYRVSRDEENTGTYKCPARKCKGVLRRATYKMEDGHHVKLHACPSCLFIIKSSDILADHCAPPQPPQLPVKGEC